MIARRERISRKQLVLLAVSCLPLVGCGGTYNASVAGLATMDGAPLPSGSIAFIPDQPGPSSYAAILNDGSYVVNTGREEGLPAGSYTVTVVSRERAIEDTSGRGLPPRPGKQITHAWYATKNSPPLKFNVESGSNEINLELTSEPPPGWQPKKRRRR